MANLKSIKSKILSYKKTGTVTHAMEAVSAVKMRKAQGRALGARAYAAAALSVLERLSATVDASHHPLMMEVRPPSLKTCFVVVTSDKGLAGSLNSAVIRATEREMARLNLATKDVVIAAMGRRGGDYFASRGYDVRIKQENVSDAISESEMRDITNKVLLWHSAGEIGDCFVAYQNFISTFEQSPTIRQIIPITPHVMHDMVAGIRPAKGRYAPSNPEHRKMPAAYNIEPDADTVLAELLPLLLNIAIFYALLESKASEHSARMVAMKSATDK